MFLTELQIQIISEVIGVKEVARITNEELKLMIDDLADKLPNGEIRNLQLKIEELQVELKKFTKSLYNPDDGLKVRINKNSEYIAALKEEKTLETVRIVDKFRDNYSRLLWALYAMLLGLIFKEQIISWFQ